MTWAVVAVLVVYAFGYFAFAAMEPPDALRSFFRVPGIFIFLPDRFIAPVGRVFAGVCCLGLAGLLAVYTLGRTSSSSSGASHRTTTTTRR